MGRRSLHLEAVLWHRCPCAVLVSHIWLIYCKVHMLGVSRSLFREQDEFFFVISRNGFFGIIIRLAERCRIIITLANWSAREFIYVGILVARYCRWHFWVSLPKAPTRVFLLNGGRSWWWGKGGCRFNKVRTVCYGGTCLTQVWWQMGESPLGQCRSCGQEAVSWWYSTFWVLHSQLPLGQWHPTPGLTTHLSPRKEYTYVGEGTPPVPVRLATMVRRGEFMDRGSS